METEHYSPIRSQLLHALSCKISFINGRLNNTKFSLKPLNYVVVKTCPTDRLTRFDRYGFILCVLYIEHTKLSWKQTEVSHKSNVTESRSHGKEELLTDPMQEFFWETNSRLAIQQISHISGSQRYIIVFKINNQ
jgi:hypothetical protein